MPIYEYVCPTCHKAFEKRVSAAQADKVTCPQCGEQKTKRKLSKITVRYAESPGAAASSDAFPTCSTGLCGLPRTN
jgi:putative FmdB family regulatory protein